MNITELPEGYVEDIYSITKLYGKDTLVEILEYIRANSVSYYSRKVVRVPLTILADDQMLIKGGISNYSEMIVNGEFVII